MRPESFIQTTSTNPMTNNWMSDSAPNEYSSVPDRLLSLLSTMRRLLADNTTLSDGAKEGIRRDIYAADEHLSLHHGEQEKDFIPTVGDMTLHIDNRLIPSVWLYTNPDVNLSVRAVVYSTERNSSVLNQDVTTLSLRVSGVVFGEPVPMIYSDPTSASAPPEPVASPRHRRPTRVIDEPPLIINTPNIKNELII